MYDSSDVQEALNILRLKPPIEAVAQAPRTLRARSRAHTGLVRAMVMHGRCLMCDGIDRPRGSRGRSVRG